MIILKTSKLQYHLYAALGPHREKLQSNQRTAKDFFLPEDLRQALQRKSEATAKTFSSMSVLSSCQDDSNVLKISHFRMLSNIIHLSHWITRLHGTKPYSATQHGHTRL